MCFIIASITQLNYWIPLLLLSKHIYLIYPSNNAYSKQVKKLNTVWKKSIDVYFNRLKILLLCFDHAYVNLWEKQFGRCTAYSCRLNAFVELHHFSKKEQTQLNNSSKTFSNQWESMSFCKLNNVVLNVFEGSDTDMAGCHWCRLSLKALDACINGGKNYGLSHLFCEYC